MSSPDQWSCSFAENLKPCHQPARWIIKRDNLTVGACHKHRDAIVPSLTPKVHILDLDAMRGHPEWMPL